jgi:hypothetical protein
MNLRLLARERRDRVAHIGARITGRLSDEVKQCLGEVVTSSKFAPRALHIEARPRRRSF